MSFGYGVGDIIAVSTLARNIWGRFRDASDQFDAIQREVANLCLVLDEIKNNISSFRVTDKQAEDLSKLVLGCRSVLDDTEKLIQKNEDLGAETSGLGSKTQKAWKKLKWNSATVNGLRDCMVSSTTYLNTFSTSLASQLSRATKDKVDVIAEDTQSLRLNQSQQERNKVLQWISPLNFTSRQIELSGRRQEGTGSWLLESPKFQEWVSEEGKTLVCQGMPGAGKTMLASLVIDHLQQLPGVENVVTAYIYCEYGKQEEQTPVNLIASVTKQLLQHQMSIPEDVQKIYRRHLSKETQPSFEEVLEMTGSSMSRFSRIYLIVDALDELWNTDQVRQNLIGRLRSLQDLHHFSLMTTSRYIPYLILDFYQPLHVDVQASPEDIRKYVEGHVSDLPSCVRKDLGLQESISSAIVDAVEGMFLLAQLHMDSLKDKTSPKLIKKALEVFPKGSNALDLAYHGALQRIEGQMEGFRFLAKQLLGWLTYSERLMTTKEVQHALAIEPGTRDFDEDNLGDIDEIVGFCAGLVIVDEETHTIRLVHYTTQDYFRKNGDRILATAGQDIAISCLTYLLYETFGDGWVQREPDKGRVRWLNWELKTRRRVLSARVQEHPFLEYAAKYWATHARLCWHRNVKELTMSFAKDDRRVSSASQVMLLSDKQYAFFRDMDRTKSRSPLCAMHLIAYLGYEEMMSELLQHRFEADSEDSTHRTPLWWAAWQGHEAVVSLLLSQSHVNVNNRVPSTPLGIAATSGRDQVVKLLFQREDLDINMSNDHGISPLSAAVYGRHSKVTELLLTRSDVEVNIRGSHGERPLTIAAEMRQMNIVKQLLKHKNIQVNVVDRYGRSPLATAVSSSYESLVETLLRRPEIEVNTKDYEGRTPLHEAATRGFEVIANLLLGHVGINVNPKDDKGNTPLTYAVRSRHSMIVKLLCAHPDVDLEATDNMGRDLEEDLEEDSGEDWEEWDLYEALSAKRVKLEECQEIVRTAIETRLRKRPQISETVSS